MAGERMEQRGRLRPEPSLTRSAVVVRGGTDTVDKLRRHAHRTARAWSLDGVPLLGVSVFAALDDVEVLLRTRFATFRTVHLPTAGALRDADLELLPTGRSPHYTIRLATADDNELALLVAALGPPKHNQGYGIVRRKEGHRVPGRHRRGPQRRG
jgi:hypothetical protein